MKDNEKAQLSRREFAQKAALLSASLVPVGIALPENVPPALPAQLPENLPKLSPESQAEADARFQRIVNQYGSRFDAEQKSLIQGLCIYLQPNLDRVRAFPVENGDSPAVYLKPLMEREKKPPTNPAPAATKKP